MIVTSHKLSDDVLAVLLFPVLVLAITVRLPRSFRERISRRVLGATRDEWDQIPAATKASTRRNDWVTATMFICFNALLAWLAMFLVSANTGILVAVVGGCLVAMGIHIRRRRRVLRVLGRASLLVLTPAMAAILSTPQPTSGSVGLRSLGETAEEVGYAPDSTSDMVVGSFGEMLGIVCDVGLATNQECERVKRFLSCMTCVVGYTACPILVYAALMAFLDPSPNPPSVAVRIGLLLGAIAECSGSLYMCLTCADHREACDDGDGAAEARRKADNLGAAADALYEFVGCVARNPLFVGGCVEILWQRLNEIFGSGGESVAAGAFMGRAGLGPVDHEYQGFRALTS